MNFYQPIYLLLLLIIPFYIYFEKKMNKKRKEQISNILTLRLLSQFSHKINNEKIKITLTSTIILFLSLSLARPQWGIREFKNVQKGVSIVFAIDLSNSMNAEDIKPSRIKSLQLGIGHFLDVEQSDEIGIVGFANSAFIASPLTNDYKSLKEYVYSLSPNLIKNQGTDIGNAIKVSLKLLKYSTSREKIIILISDGEDHGQTLLEQATIAKKMGVRIYTIGLATSEGSAIPLKNEDEFQGYLKDKNGKTVISKANFNDLKNIANLTKGQYFLSSTGNLYLSDIYKQIQKLEKSNLSENRIVQREDKYSYFLMIALLLFIFDFFPNIFSKKQ